MLVHNLAISTFTATAGAQLNVLCQRCDFTHLSNNCFATGLLT